MQQTEEKIETMKKAVKAKSPLAKALLEDEAVRLASEKAAKLHLDRIDEEESRIPYWIWAMLWFVFGMLFTVTVTNLGMNLWKYTGGCSG